MRKLFLFAFMLLALTAAPAAAQTIGFKVGPTFSKMDVEDDEAGDLETLTNFGGGGFIRFGFAGLSLQTELLALTKGFKQSDEVNDLEAKLKMTYVEIPVTAMFSLGAGPYLFAGPSVAFEVGCEFELEGDGASLDADCDGGDEELDRKKVDFSLHGGAGFHIPMGPGSLLIEGRYIHGLSNLNDDDTIDASMKHRTWAVMAGYAIRLGF